MTIVSEGITSGGTLLEREDVLAALSGAYSEARAGQGRLALVAGEAGVGKTSVVRSFVAGTSRTIRVLVGACDPLFTPRPLAPFADLAPAAGLEEFLANSPTASDVFAKVRDELGSGSTILILEDLHWADEATLDVLRLLARRIAAVPALVVATYRDDELGRTHPLRIVLGELGATPGVEHVHVEPLSRGAVDRLAESYEVDAQKLYSLTSGNPFYVREVLDAGGNGVPATVRSAVLARTARLSDRALMLAEAVSVAPPRLDAWALERVCGDAVGRLDECLAAGVLVSSDSGVAFRHELARLAVEESLSATRAVGLHRSVLETLSDPPYGPPDFARLAHHAEAAGDAEAVLEFAPKAATQARSAGAYREEAAQLARALRFAESLSPGEQAALLEGRSRALYLADDQVEAIEVVKQAIACRELEGASLQQARSLSELTSYLTCRGLYRDAREAIAEAASLIAGQPETREVAFVHWQRSQMRGHDGDLDGKIELAWQAMEVADKCGDHETAAEARVSAATGEMQRNPSVGRPLLEQTASELRDRRFVEQTARALNNLGTFGAGSYDHELANAFLPEAFEYCVEHNQDLWRINVLAWWARSKLDQGRWTEAAELVTQILEDPRESPWPHCEALRVLALVRARRGDPGAREALDAAHEVDLSPEEFSAVVDLAAACAEVAWLSGDSAEVDRVTAPVLAEAAARDLTDDATRLVYWRRLAGLDSEPDAHSGLYAAAAVGDWRVATEEWQRRELPYETALALSEGDDEQSLLRALEICRELGARPLESRVARQLRRIGANGIPRGPRASTRENAAHLTARQLEVLELVSAGLQNAEIADRLVVSKRTVDHHVSAILRKLDAGTRGEAVASARQLGVLEDR